MEAPDLMQVEGWAMIGQSSKAHYFVRCQSLCRLYLNDSIYPGPEWHKEDAKCPACNNALKQQHEER